MPATAAPPEASAAGLELARRLDEADQQLGDADFALDLGDGLALLAVAGLLADATTRQSGARGADLSSAQALAEWLEDHLAAPPLTPAAGEPDPAAVFAPFATAGDVESFLAAGGGELLRSAVGNVREAATYREAVIAAFGGTAAAAAPDAGGAASLIATCGMCCIPVSSVAFELDGNAAYSFLSGTALALQAQQRRLDRGVSGGRDALAVAQTGVVARKLSEVGQLALELPPDRGGEGVPHADFSAADVFAGALIELRADCADAGELLKSTRGRRDTFTSPANRMGVGEPIVIDHVERVQKLRAFQVKVQDWISETLMLAARAPEDVEELDMRVDKVALGVGLVEILLGVIRVSNAMIDSTNKADLAEDLLPYAINLEAQMVPIEAYLNPDDIADYLEDASSDVSTLITSFKWSQLVFKAMSDATDIVLAIETGGNMGGMAGPLRAEAMSAGAAGRAAAGAVAQAELDRLAAGALIVTMAKPKKLTGKAAVRARNRRARLRGRRGEKGLGLGPGRPRPSIESYTGPPGKVRIPDNLPKGFRSFWEVKNVAKLRLTWQLADFMLYAQATGRRLRLYIRPSIKGSTLPGTVMTKELKAVIKLLKQDGLIEVKYLKKY